MTKDDLIEFKKLGFCYDCLDWQWREGGVTKTSMNLWLPIKGLHDLIVVYDWQQKSFQEIFLRWATRLGEHKNAEINSRPTPLFFQIKTRYWHRHHGFFRHCLLAAKETFSILVAEIKWALENREKNTSFPKKRKTIRKRSLRKWAHKNKEICK